MDLAPPFPKVEKVEKVDIYMEKQIHTIYNQEDIEELLNNPEKRGVKIGDTIELMTSNQMGVKRFEVIDLGEGKLGKKITYYYGMEDDLINNDKGYGNKIKSRKYKKYRKSRKYKKSRKSTLKKGRVKKI